MNVMTQPGSAYSLEKREEKPVEKPKNNSSKSKKAKKPAAAKAQKEAA